MSIFAKAIGITGAALLLLAAARAGLAWIPSQLASRIVSATQL